MALFTTIGENIMPNINRPRRNVVARLAIMRKGGVHDKSNKAKRQKQKQKLAKQIRTKNFGPYLFTGSFTDSLFHSFIPVRP